MSNPGTPIPASPVEESESFQDLLGAYERSHRGNSEDVSGQRQGTVIAVNGDSVFVDVGSKVEGVLPLSSFTQSGDSVKPGDTVLVSLRGRNEEGYYQLSR